MNHKAWVAKAAKQSMALESVDLGPLGAEDVEVAVEHCGLCRSDLSVLNNDWGASPEAFRKAAEAAETGCPISKLFRTKITMDARLEA